MARIVVGKSGSKPVIPMVVAINNTKGCKLVVSMGVEVYLFSK